MPNGFCCPDPDCSNGSKCGNDGAVRVKRKKNVNTYEIPPVNESKLARKSFSKVVTERLDETKTHVVEEVHIDIAADFAIGPDLMQELSDSAGVMAWYIQLKEDAHVMMKQARYREHSLREDLYDAIKSENPKLSETAIRTRIYATPKMRKRVEKYMLWAQRYRLIEDLCKAWKERNDNLRTMEASLRRDRD